VRTSSGNAKIELLAVGMKIQSINLNEPRSLVEAKITRIKVSTASTCLCINQILIATPTQPVYEEKYGWIPLGDLRSGMQILGGDGGYIRIESIENMTKKYDVYEIETDHHSHNFIANGIVCHNVK
jgi:hypothetical protein